MQKDVLLTPDGLEKLKQEIEELSTTKRREVADRIREAREFGDISENSEYDDAKNEQAMLESRIATLEDKLRSARVIEASELSADVVRVGSLVSVSDDKGSDAVYTIVGSTESDPSQNRLSNESPVGKALVGRKKGDAVTVQLPNGRSRKLTVTDIQVALVAEAEPAATGGGEAELLAARRRKLDALRAAGVDPFPHAFPGVVAIAEAKAPHEALAAGEETDARVRVAGRIAARRGQGKAAFIDLVDRSGRIQLHARADVLGAESLEQLVGLDLGDLLGADGTIFRTRRGELSVRLDAWTLLAKSLRPPPEKHHGLADTETRLRHRELDLIANEEARELFITRARVVSAIRRFLDAEGFVEVETPVLQPIYGGALARPFTTHYHALDRTMYLRIATELYLKRLIVGGLERVYELGKDFRNEGLSPKHNPEFTMLEWYEAYADWEVVADRCERLVTHIAPEEMFARPWARETLAGAIAARSDGVDVLAHRSLESLRDALRTRGLEVPETETTWAGLVDFLLSKHVEPTLRRATILHDYPVELSPFAKRHREHDGLVERFEAFAGGIEIANAFSELNDPDDQRRRFDEQRRHAEAGDEHAQPYDEDYIRALEHGMPPTGGIGIGIDRLVMLLTGRSAIREVVLFPALR